MKNRKHAELLATMVLEKNVYEWYKKQDEETKKEVWKLFWTIGNVEPVSLIMISVLVNYFPENKPEDFKPEGIMYMDDKQQELLLTLLVDVIRSDLAMSVLGGLNEIN